MQKIKIAYNWIGPRGPLPNADIPNILSMANVAQGADSHSRFFWADNLWRDIFKKDARFELTSVHDLNRDTPFIYPFMLGWRVDFVHYFFGNNGILEHGHCPGHIRDAVISGRGYYLVEMADESFLHDLHLNALHSYFQNAHVPLHKVIYLTGCGNAEAVYDDYCTRHDIPNTPRNRLTMLSLCKAQVSLSIHLQQLGAEIEPAYDQDIVPEKLFLSWNRRYRSHRSVLALGLDRLGLIERSHISMPKFSTEMASMSFMNTLDTQLLAQNGITNAHVDRFNRKLPLVLDDEQDIGEMCGDFKAKCRNYYQNSLVSIVTETNFDSDMMSLTEKSFKPFKEKHPFLLAAVPGTLAKLRELGFRTFGDFWDESYDHIDDHWSRAQEILRICDQISKWDDDEVRDFRRRVKPILEHNYQQVLKDLSVPLCEQLYGLVSALPKYSSPETSKRCLVLGGGGFIGTHLVNSLVNQGHHVIAADLKRPKWCDSEAQQFAVADLRDRDTVRQLMNQSIDEVYQLAADMGGADYIFTGDHDADIMSSSALININTLEAMREFGVSKVFYSSSACIYPRHNQEDPSNPNCSEHSAYPADPDSEYGWEKLFSERLYLSYARNHGLTVRIARFHNVFGPLTEWQGDRAKAPAALCRKVLQSHGKIDIYGDGEQTRSFLYVSEAVEGIHRLMAGDFQGPVNLGSDRMVTINQLVSIIAAIDGKQLSVNHIAGPLGVRGRNSDNRLVLEKLGWQPQDCLEQGLRETYEWIRSIRP